MSVESFIDKFRNIVCLHEECNNTACMNNEHEVFPLYCNEHSTDTMININNERQIGFTIYVLHFTKERYENQSDVVLYRYLNKWKQMKPIEREEWNGL